MSSSDDALLARLNALRPSSVNLSHSSPSDPPLSVPKPIQSPEQNLSSRLKALRTASETNTTSLPRPSSPPPTPAPICPKAKGNEPRPNLPSPHHEHGALSPSKTGHVTAVFRDASREVLSISDDLKGTRLFNRNADEDLKLAREATAAADEVVKDIKKKWGDEREVGRKDDDVKRLRGDAAAALERAKRTLAGDGDGAPHAQDNDIETEDDDDESEQKTSVGATDDSDDESERDDDEEADTLLAELMDDVALDFEQDSRRGLHQQESPVGSPTQLPPPPSFITPVGLTSPKSKDAAGSGLRAGDEEGDDEADFHRAMKERMSALRSPSPQPPGEETQGLSLPSAPSSEPVDSLGLPSAPVDKLSSISLEQQPREDSICRICYDKATIFCEGCEEEFEEWNTKDDAMFCARCWKEAHLGETADEEERGHQWVTIRRGK